jgi:hypothetical protein
VVLRGSKQQEGGENCIMRRFLCHQIFFKLSDVEDEIVEACGMHGRDMHMGKYEGKRLL